MSEDTTPQPPVLSIVPSENDNAVEVTTCGARTRGEAQTPCKNAKGFNTDHPGEGRCYLHGGRGGRPLVHGRRSGRMVTPLAERVEDYLQSTELLSLDREVAIVKAMLEHQMEDVARYEVEWEQHQELLQEWQADGADPKDKPASPRGAQIDPDTIKLAATVVRTAYEMRFNKRFSIPVAEVSAAFQQIALIFDEVCKRYSVPEAARAEFAEKVKHIKVSNGGNDPVGDSQLRRAGEGRPGIDTDILDDDLDPRFT